VPDSIAAKEILPQIKKEPGYLEQKNIKVFKDWKDNAKEMDPKLISCPASGRAIWDINSVRSPAP